MVQFRSSWSDLLSLVFFVTFLLETTNAVRVQSSIDFHFNIVRSKSKTIYRGKKQKIKLKEKKNFLNGSVDPVLDDEYENNPQNRRDCSVVLSCDGTSPYRTADGSCNNLRHPDLGSAFQPYRRFLRPQYGDRISSPRTMNSKGRDFLPSAREVSRRFHSSDEGVAEDQGISHMVMQWGQFLDHDISITPVQASIKSDGEVKSITCCPGVDAMPENMFDLYTIDPNDNCFPIPVSRDDPTYGSKGCINFPRSVQVRNADCKVSPAEQVNQITAFIDASNVYGSSDSESDELRSFVEGLLSCRVMTGRSRCPTADLLPASSVDCGATRCFKAGDVRANEQVGLASTHTLFVREHNRIARALHQLNGHWDDERLFQETRKIVGAMMQVITYTEFLPIILGTAMDTYNLSPANPTTETGRGRGRGRRNPTVRGHRGYSRGREQVKRSPSGMSSLILRRSSETSRSNSSSNCGDCDAFGERSKRAHTVDPSVRNVFATAAYRFGHSQIRGMTTRRNQEYRSIRNTILRNAFGDAQSMESNSCVLGDWLRGLVEDQCPRVDRFMTPEVTEHMFEDTDGNSLDLAALNIQRGRDHGLPGYNDWRKFCRLRTFKKYSRMTEHSDSEIRILTELYGHPDDIDLFTAGVSERPVNGGLVGETFSCLLGLQFQALKEGDRFWYETDDETVGFTPDQLLEIRKVTLARVICENTDTASIQPNAFKTQDPSNPRQSCDSLLEGQMNLQAWRESV